MWIFLKFYEFTFSQVVKNVFQNISIEQLKSLRLVCKYWNQASLRFLHEKCIIKLSNSDSLSKYNDYMFTSTTETNEDGSQPSFQNYSIKLLESANTTERSSVTLFEQFWEANKLSIKELSLSLTPNLARGILTRIFSSTKEDEEAQFQLSSLKVYVLKFFGTPYQDQAQADDESSGVIQVDDTGNNRSVIPIRSSVLKAFQYSNYSFDNSSLEFPIDWKYFFETCNKLKVIPAVRVLLCN